MRICELEHVIFNQNHIGEKNNGFSALTVLLRGPFEMNIVSARPSPLLHVHVHAINSAWKGCQIYLRRMSLSWATISSLQKRAASWLLCSPGVYDLRSAATSR